MTLQENSTLVLLPEGELSNLKQELSEIKELIKERNNKAERLKWIPKREACIRLNVSNKTMDKYFKMGVLPFAQFKGKIYVKSEDLENHLNKYYVG